MADDVATIAELRAKLAAAEKKQRTAEDTVHATHPCQST
jgi:hypothetical protein